LARGSDSGERTLAQPTIVTQCLGFVSRLAQKIDPAALSADDLRLRALSQIRACARTPGRTVPGGRASRRTRGDL